MSDLFRIKKVEVQLPSTLVVRFRGQIMEAPIDLAGWIGTGGDILAPLRDPAVFSNAAISDHGAAVSWDDGDGDLSIDAMHLKQISDEQKPFTNEALRQWQSTTDLSNAEAADFVGVSLSTWNTYRGDATIPKPVALALRAAARDPLFLQAHLRPRTAGRPRKEQSAS